MDYDSLRHFADSWGLVYMMAIFLAVVFLVLRPGAKKEAEDAAMIPFRDTTGEDNKPWQSEKSTS